MTTTNDWDKVIKPTHPSISEDITVGDCIGMSMSTGVNPQTIAGVIIGSILPNKFIAQRLSLVLGEEIMEEIINDFNPMRRFCFIDDSDTQPGYKVHHFLPVEEIEPGDRILTSSDKWIIISDVTRGIHSVRLFSNDHHLATLNKKVSLIVSKPLKKKSEASMRKEITEEDLAIFDNEEEKSKMVENMMKILKSKRNSD